MWGGAEYDVGAREQSDEVHSGTIDLNALLAPKRRMAHQRNGVYSTVLGLCHRRIRHKAKRNPGITWCSYTVPVFVPGLPRYNIEACIRYCLAKLRLNGFDITLVPPRTIMVSWQRYDEKTRRRAHERRVRETNRNQMLLPGSCKRSSKRRQKRKVSGYLDAPAPRHSDRVPIRRPPAFQANKRDTAVVRWKDQSGRGRLCSSR